MGAVGVEEAVGVAVEEEVVAAEGDIRKNLGPWGASRQVEATAVAAVAVDMGEGLQKS